MSANERRSEIMRILFGRRFETMQNLAVEFDVSIRTIHYDIETLTCDYPLETVRGKNGGVRLPDWYQPYKNLLSREQKQALITAAESADVKNAQLLNEILIKFGGKSI